jgi:peptidoglycan/LPS O-acetylase OafA/YrhL
MASERGLPPSAQQRSARSPAEQRIAVLDGWRGISILLVIAGHLLDYRYLSTSTTDFQYRLVEVVSTSGVCIFFTISGFIIVSLAIREHERTGAFSTVGFYIRRCFRILPPFWVYLACVAILAALGFISQRSDQTLLALGFVCNLPGADCGMFAGHVWSLAYEEQFYILLPFLMWWQRPRRTLPFLLAFLISVPFLVRALHLGHVGFLAAHGAFYFSLICAGAFCAAYRDWIRRLAMMRYSNYASAAAILALIGMWVLDAAGHSELALPVLQRARADIIPVLEPLCIAWLVAGSVYQSSYLTRLLEWAPLNFIGTISFSLYLWQALFINSPASYPLKSVLLFPPLMFVCAAVSYWLIERPCVRLGKRVLESPRFRRQPQSIQPHPARRATTP